MSLLGTLELKTWHHTGCFVVVVVVVGLLAVETRSAPAPSPQQQLGTSPEANHHKPLRRMARSERLQGLAYYLQRKQRSARGIGSGDNTPSWGIRDILLDSDSNDQPMLRRAPAYFPLEEELQRPLSTRDVLVDLVQSGYQDSPAVLPFQDRMDVRSIFSPSATATAADEDGDSSIFGGEATGLLEKRTSKRSSWARAHPRYMSRKRVIDCYFHVISCY